MAIIKVTRTIVVEGKEEWVRATLDKSKTYIHPDRPLSTPSGTITETSRIEEVVNG